VRLCRNAYGSQADSFTADLKLTLFDTPFRGVFIRAPIITVVEREGAESGDRPEVLGRHGGDPVLVEAGPFLLATFHPELTDDLRLHRHFIGLAARKRLEAQRR
jgi:5'-phosphate synthase pdxT subunit